jgi:hypothetical protein
MTTVRMHKRQDMSIMEELHSSIGDLMDAHGLEKEYASEMNALFQETINKASEITGKFLQKLHEKKPDPSIVEKMITAFPSSLNYRTPNEVTDPNDATPPLPLPILENACAPGGDGLQYIALLAKEGVKYNIGGDEGRGGLLTLGYLGENESFSNALRTACTMARYSNDGGMSCLRALQELREAKILNSDDIADHELLIHSCHPASEKVFEFFADWDPAALKAILQRGERSYPIIHRIIAVDDIKMEALSVFLKSALKYYPEKLGLLFECNSGGGTAVEYAFFRWEKQETFRALGKSIPFDQANSPILHIVVEKAPHLLNDFATYYPSAVHLRDSSGRKLYQTKLACGNSTYMNSASYFVQLRDDEIAETDPKTDLYPYMVAASGQTSDLSAVYYLLRRNPALLNN